MPNEERWAAMSAAFSAFQILCNDETRQASRIAERIVTALADYAGCPNRDYVWLFSYTPGETARYDKFGPAKDGYQAVSAGDDGSWLFGLGVTCEHAPGAKPQRVFQWAMSIHFAKPMEIYNGITQTKMAVQSVNGQYDLTPVAKEMYDALLSMFEAGARGEQATKRIGFFDR